VLQESSFEGLDVFNVNATGQVRLNNQIVVNTPSIISLTLKIGLGGTMASEADAAAAAAGSSARSCHRP